jgi:hypothetical protein
MVMVLVDLVVVEMVQDNPVRQPQEQQTQVQAVGVDHLVRSMEELVLVALVVPASS